MGELALPIRGRPEPLVGGRLSSDERLAKLVAKGSSRAFALLYQRHHQALYRYCRSIVRDPDDAQDALQSAMTRALAALRKNERDLAVRPWLFRIVHNEAISLVRRRRPHADLGELEAASLHDVEASFEQRERLTQLVRDLQALGERQRAALLMRELSGLSIEEIAGALSITPGAAKQALFEARGALQEFAEGRAMDCETVRHALCEDRRMLRGRRVRAHLRQCEACAALNAQISARSEDLRALAPPLPLAVATAMLAKVLAGGGAGGHAAGAALGSGAALGKPAAVSLAAKALAGVAVVAVAVTGTARLALQHSPPAGAHAPASILSTAGSRHGGASSATASQSSAARTRARAAHAQAARRRHRRSHHAQTPAGSLGAASVGLSKAPVTSSLGEAGGEGAGAAGSGAQGRSRVEAHRRAPLASTGHGVRSSPAHPAPARPTRPEGAGQSVERTPTLRPAPADGGEGSQSGEASRTHTQALSAPASN